MPRMHILQLRTCCQRWVLAASDKYMLTIHDPEVSMYMPRMHILHVRTCCQRWALAASDKYMLTIHDPAVNICRGCTFCRWGHAAKGEYLLPVIVHAHRTWSSVEYMLTMHILQVRTCSLRWVLAACSPDMVQLWIHAEDAYSKSEDILPKVSTCCQW